LTPLTPASRLPEFGTTIFTVVSQLAQELGAINVGQGIPDFEPPERLQELVGQHVRARHNQYAPMAGVPALRAAIARKVARCYGRTVDPDHEITVTSGGTDALTTTILALVHPGDEVILLDPAYDSYAPAVRLAGGHCRYVPLLRPGFSIDWDRLSSVLSARTRLIVTNFPHNPSGALLTREDLGRLAELLRPTSAYLIADEVYEHMVFDDQAFMSVNTHRELAERAVVVSSFGKTYHATGWKVGYCVAPKGITAEVRKVHQFVTFATATPLQHALADYMDQHPEWERELPAFYRRKRDLLVDLLKPSRLTIDRTAATYFQLVDYSQISELRDAEFAMHLLRDHGVACIPLSPFCGSQPDEERLVRLCFAKCDETLAAAAERLSRL
jgi:methionine transaminase